jgi:predicted thioesterase
LARRARLRWSSHGALANRFKDATLPPVLATPIMIMMMENAALNALKPYLEAGQTRWARTSTSAISLRHRSAAA